MRIAVDIGFGYTKAVNELKKEVSFPSVVSRKFASTLGGALGQGQDDFIVSIRLDGQERVDHFHVGDAAMITGGSRSWEEDASQNSNLNVLVATAVHQLMDKNVPVQLAVGLPMSYYVAQRKAIKDTLQKLNVTISIGGKEKHVQVESVFVFPQSAGVYYSTLHEIDGTIKSQNLFNRPIGIIDVGYNTVDLLYMARGKKGLFPREDLSIGEDLGMSVANKTILMETSQLIGGNADLLEVEKALHWFNCEFDYKGKHHNIRSIRDNVYALHAQKIISWVKQTWGEEINNLYAIIIGGGGGESLFKHLQENLPSTTKADRPEFANAYGYLAAQALALKEKQLSTAQKG